MSDKHVSLTSKHKNPEGGLNEAGRAKYNRETGSHLKRPVSAEQAKKSPASAKRRSSFCKRMKGLKAKLTSAKTANDPNSRVNKALRKWDCNESLEASMKDDKKWIQAMHMKKGALSKKLHVPEEKNIPVSKLEKATHSESPALRKQANLALTLKRLAKHRKGDAKDCWSKMRDAMMCKDESYLELKNNLAK